MGKEKGWEYKMHVTFIEIYNEQVFCLLREEGSEKVDLSIKQDKKGKTFVEGANKLEIDPTDLKAIDDLMDTAAASRHGINGYECCVQSIALDFHTALDGHEH